MKKRSGKQEEESLKMGDDKQGSSINSLPDSILLHILSFLETKYVVTTCVLSKRWKNLWVSVPNLIFSESKVISKSSLRNFMDCVDRVLFLRDSPTIQKFSLTYKREWQGRPLDSDRLNSWLCAVVKFHVEQLIIDISSDDVFPNLPPTLFTCKSLVESHLKDQLCIDFPSYVNLPNLKTLEISIVDPGDSLNDGFFRGFPEDEHSPYVVNVKVVIDAPVLECLVIDDDCGAWHSIKNRSSSLVRAQIDVRLDNFPEDMQPDRANGVLELFKGISNVKYLCIDGNALFTFCNVTHSILSFDYLSKLPEVLQSLPKLESLDVCVWAGKNLEAAGIDLSDQDTRLSEALKLMESHVVPSCLLSHLRVIEVGAFVGKNDELQLVKYLLKNSKVLSKMTIGFLCDVAIKDKKILERKILRFPRGSKTCNFQFL
ncbi:unnamed protein product [Ilex paraguariensis]|uniref:F-box domain-containing protein n=1 Tax=Ilex paraguariensis TaxID=185542 RepID=A0ABC8S9P3_9AQUA